MECHRGFGDQHSVPASLESVGEFTHSVAPRELGGDQPRRPREHWDAEAKERISKSGPSEHRVFITDGSLDGLGIVSLVVADAGRLSLHVRS